MFPLPPYRFGNPAAMGGFSPNALSPLTWYDMTQESLSNGAVSSAADFSGNSRAVTQSTPALQPVFSTTGMGGLPELQFDGVNDLLNLSGTGGYTLNGPLTMWLVGRIRGSTAARTPFLSIGQQGSSGNYVTIESYSGFLGFYASAVARITSLAATTSPVAIIVRISSATVGTAVSGTITVNVNGVDYALGGAGNWASMTGMNYVTLGAFAGSGQGTYGNCGIGEAGTINRDIGSTDAATLMTYLKTKWGIA